MKGISMDRLTVLAMFSWQYLLMAFLACLGIVQMAAARSDRRHLWIMRRRLSTTLAGVVLLLVGTAFFYLIPLWTAGPWGPPDPVHGAVTWARASSATIAGARNINDTAGGLAGHWQALWWAVAWIAAVFFARAIGRVERPGKGEEPSGDRDKNLVGVIGGGRR